MKTLHTRLIAFSLAGALGLPHAAGAAPVSITAADQRDVMVTVYNGNLGLVKEVREVRLAPGLVEARYADVASQIDPPRCTCAPSRSRRACASSSRTTSTTCSRARS